MHGLGFAAGYSTLSGSSLWVEGVAGVRHAEPGDPFGRGSMVPPDVRHWDLGGDPQPVNRGEYGHLAGKLAVQMR